MNDDHHKKCRKCGRMFGTDHILGRDLCMECWTAKNNRPVGKQQADAEDRPGNPRRVPIQADAAVPNLTESARLNMGFNLLRSAGDMDRDDGE